MYEREVRHIGYDIKEGRNVFLTFKGKKLSFDYLSPYQIQVYLLENGKYLLFIQHTSEVGSYFYEIADNLRDIKNEAHMYLREKVTEIDELKKVLDEMIIDCLVELIANEIDNRDVYKRAKIIEIS